MNRINFSVSIDAPASKVWDVLWNDNSYRQWTTVFCEGSYMETDWQVGGNTRFLGPGEGGMYSTIDGLKENQMVSFRHIGEVKDGVNLPLDDKSKTWSGATESYYLEEKNGKTELRVELDITEDHEAFFKESFPKGLEKVKELSEA